ncbi:DNA polymerase III subunit delta [Caulifigura coniformis]|uniref:DNA polymerase III subunit delta n=1 Tax=Caulifigura coniformis TaxID=2527983 RepID=A0A517S8T0_9PLAN|nr:DNA polymerase III subunit delta [Caulifigura coniformis]QDT52530.1 DNA polymerase III subunit delta [Caulifigura coniformis]
MHAVEFLRKPAPQQAAFIVLHGGESTLKASSLAAVSKIVLGEDADETSLVRLEGDVDWARVRDELATVSMFTSRRLVVVEDADDFVTKHRGQLESYIEKPSKKSTFVLDLKSWKKNTRLAKKLDELGLEIDCSELAGPRLTGWLVESAESEYGKQLSRDAAALMVELAGSGLGLLEQELGKLASYVGDRPRITPEDVRQMVGGWKAETTWTMLDAVRDGDPGSALSCLEKLLTAGEAGPRLLGGISFVFRKLGDATERSREGVPLPAALKDAGVFFRDIEKAERYLRRVRRPRAEKILARLLKADSDLKGGSPLTERLQMELLLLWLAGVETR